MLEILSCSRGRSGTQTDDKFRLATRTIDIWDGMGQRHPRYGSALLEDQSALVISRLRGETAILANVRCGFVDLSFGEVTWGKIHVLDSNNIHDLVKEDLGKCWRGNAGGVSRVQ